MLSRRAVVLCAVVVLQLQQQGVQAHVAERLSEQDGAAAGAAGALAAGSPLRVPDVALNNGVRMPMVGLGTWQYNETTAYKASKLALQVGYRHLDTAVIYGNARGVGRAVREWLNETGAKRSEVFITTKIGGGYNRSHAAAALDGALDELGMSYVDLMLVHMPSTWELEGGPKARIEGWSAMEDFYHAGKARAIGVSHFCKRHLLDVINHGTVLPAVNQVEFHIGMGSAGPDATDDRDFVEAAGILYQSFSPLCGPCNTRELLDGEMVTRIGSKYGKSGAQVSLRWQVQQGIPVIPKTDTKKHLLENADIFDWELDEEDMGELTAAESPPATGGPNSTSGDCTIARRR